MESPYNGKNTTTVYYTELNKNSSTKDVLLPFELLAIGSSQIANMGVLKLLVVFLKNMAARPHC